MQIKQFMGLAFMLSIGANLVHASPATTEKELLKTIEPLPLSHPCARWSVKKLHARAEPYQEAIEQYAKRYGVEEAVIKAVIAIESCYNHSAESPKGAQGLMQLIPDTALRFGVSNSFDTTENIQGGTRYLSWLLKRYKGDLTKVLAAYNAGEGRVDQYDGVPPYTETKHYVRNVMAVYEKLSGKKGSEAVELPALAESNSSENDNAELLANAVRALLQSANPSPNQAVLQKASYRPNLAVQPQRVQASFRSPFQVAERVATVAPPAPKPIVRPSKPGRGGFATNRARAPQLYKRAGGPDLLAQAEQTMP
ncbi:lytic transglycosylase domain-containing protein [Thiolinea disciformis]|uniref:lytic transglycosylase domain-containing protein n=1 Tax=Thiolinea disciformis TaxID=125614 RepID=UPI000377860C|nr:lytic transglycosylase domain-containing protein [Thiolinea disciformis]